MDNRLSENEIEVLRRKLNNYIKDNNFNNYDELLNISRQLDSAINKWTDLKISNGSR